MKRCLTANRKVPSWTLPTNAQDSTESRRQCITTSPVQTWGTDVGLASLDVGRAFRNTIVRSPWTRRAIYVTTWVGPGSGVRRGRGGTFIFPIATPVEP